MAELNAQPASVQSVYGWFRDDKLYVNRRYQRKLVWTLEEKQKLVDSILKKYPVPAILLAEREESPGTYEIIDGLQRLHSIVSYIETAFPTTGGTYFSIDKHSRAREAADEGLFEPAVTNDLLSQREVTTLLDYTLPVQVMRGATEAEINDVFDRINTYGHRLSDQERRQAGVQHAFSDMVRSIACEIRGDVSSNVLVLGDMPAISVDLPMSKHGYEVRADEVFWVKQGILRSTDLRDSMDEQCIADIAACVIGGDLIERSKDALDQIYLEGSEESGRIQSALQVYGGEAFTEEFKFCVGEILRVCEIDGETKLRDIVYKRKTTNPFPSVFALLLIAFHELIVQDRNKISDYAGIRKTLDGLSERLDTSRSSTAAGERRKNINTIKGLIQEFFVAEDVSSKIYGSHAATDIENSIRRSEIELANYELKQGLLSLSNDRQIDNEMIKKVAKTACAIANNGSDGFGKIIIGVTDKREDKDRIEKLDGIKARAVGKRDVVGVRREAEVLGISTEEYYEIWKDGLRKSGLQPPLLDDIMSHFDYHEFFGLGVMVITVRSQRDLSYIDGKVYWRNGDQTEEATEPKKIVALAQRF